MSIRPPTPDPRSLIPELRDFLKARLPAYMVPSVIVELAALPLTINGKVDRARLPAPELRRAEQEPYEPPQTETEIELAAIWAEVLRVPEVGRHDNFFALGGHSLLTTQALARIQVRFGVELPVRTLFTALTLAQLAEQVEQAILEQFGDAELDALLASLEDSDEG